MAVIKVNGVEVADSIVIVDLSAGRIEMGTPDRPWQTFDFNKICVEVNLYGEIEV